MSIPVEIAERYERWSRVLFEEVGFLLPASELHTRDHCSRVLLYSLLIAEARGATEDEKEALAAAAAFHDSRRKDDGYDVGHGQRAAEHYRDWCSNADVSFDERSYLVMAFHDRDDQEGVEGIRARALDPERAVELYRIFKDADALDRFRLGPDGLDERYLRTPEAKSLCGYAKDAWSESSESKGGGTPC